MFGIKNSRDFYEKLLEDFADLQDNPDSARHAINCAITAYHMHEWVWGDWLKKDYTTWRKLRIRDEVSFVAWIDENEPHFSLIQDICNGSKHFDRRKSQQTRAVGELDSGSFDSAAFDTQRLEIEIELKEGKKEWILADILIEDVVKFWRDFLLDYSPYSGDLPRPRAHLADFK